MLATFSYVRANGETNVRRTLSPSLGLAFDLLGSNGVGYADATAASLFFWASKAYGHLLFAPCFPWL